MTGEISMMDRVVAELERLAGTARELGERTGLTEKQVRNAIDRLRREQGHDAIQVLRGVFSLARPKKKTG